MQDSVPQTTVPPTKSPTQMVHVALAHKAQLQTQDLESALFKLELQLEPQHAVLEKSSPQMEEDASHAHHTPEAKERTQDVCQTSVLAET
jgi:hypothetical protein